MASRRIPITVPEDVLAQLRQRAKADRRTVSNLILHMLDQALARSPAVDARPGRAVDVPVEDDPPYDPNAEPEIGERVVPPPALAAPRPRGKDNVF